VYVCMIQGQTIWGHVDIVQVFDIYAGYCWLWYATFRVLCVAGSQLIAC
jgi:hypothetical protein